MTTDNIITYLDNMIAMYKMGHITIVSLEDCEVFRQAMELLKRLDDDGK